MSFQRMRVGDVDPANGDMITIGKLVHVVADADPGFPAGGSQRLFRPHQILFRGDFYIRFGPGDNIYRQARRFRHHGVVGQVLPLGLAVRRQNFRKRKALGCLRPPQIGPVHRVRNPAIFRPFQRIRHGNRRNHAVRGGNSVNHPVNQSGISKRPHGVVDQDQFRC